MKQTVYYLKPGGPSQFGTARTRGLGMIRDARARNVKAYFGLWLGLFAFTAVWALIDLAKYGLAGMQDRVWAQLVVLLAAVIFYLSSKPLRHHRSAFRISALPVTLSLIACGLMFTAVMVHSGLNAAEASPDSSFWSAIQASKPAESFRSSSIEAMQTDRPFTGLGAVIHTLDPQGAETAA